MSPSEIAALEERNAAQPDALENEIHLDKVFNRQLSLLATAIKKIEAATKRKLEENTLNKLCLEFILEKNKFIVAGSKNEINNTALKAEMYPRAVANPAPALEEKANAAELPAQPRPLALQAGSLLDVFIRSRGKQGVYATEADLGSLATHYNVHPIIYTDGLVAVNSRPNAALPNIKINNVGNNHWTTLFDISDNLHINPRDSVSIKAIKKYSKYSVRPDFTLDEFANILQGYTRGNSRMSRFFHLNWNHHHAELANDLFNMCMDDEHSIAEIINVCINTLPENYNKNGDFAQRMNYVCLRAFGETLDMQIEKNDPVIAVRTAPPSPQSANA